MKAKVGFSKVHMRVKRKRIAAWVEDENDRWIQLIIKTTTEENQHNAGADGACILSILPYLFIITMKSINFIRKIDGKNNCIAIDKEIYNINFFLLCMSFQIWLLACYLCKYGA